MGETQGAKGERLMQIPQRKEIIDRAWDAIVISEEVYVVTVPDPGGYKESGIEWMGTEAYKGEHRFCGGVTLSVAEYERLRERSLEMISAKDEAEALKRELISAKVEIARLRAEGGGE